jgi:glycosyltransferase involved in cell wall biosynthesis
MMRAPALSVLLPCRDAAATLDEALASLFRQTLADFEVVAVDDGSSDGTAERLSAWVAREPRMRLQRIEPHGIIAALNAGLAACQAPIVARMDADDLAEPDRLQQQLDLLRVRPDLAAVGCLVAGYPPDRLAEGFRLYIEWQNRLVEPEAIAREIFIESPLVHSSMVIRREWLERVGGYQERGWAEDYDLWLRMHMTGARFAKVPAVLLHWRDHPQRLTRTDPRYSVENFLRAKSHYLLQGPLRERDAVVVWGAGQMGRRLAKHLQRGGAPLKAFIDIDPRKLGRERRGCPIVSPDALPEIWKQHRHPVLLACVGSRGARQLIRGRLQAAGLHEGSDWWAAA